MKVKAPEEFVVVVAVAEPVSFTVTPETPRPLMVPEMLRSELRR